VLYGAGAIGGTSGGRLHLSGHDVVFIARGTHARAMRNSGLVLVSHDGETRIRVPIFDSPREIRFDEHDVVVLAMKTQAIAQAVDELSGVISVWCRRVHR